MPLAGLVAIIIIVLKEILILGRNNFQITIIFGKEFSFLLLVRQCIFPFSILGEQSLQRQTN